MAKRITPCDECGELKFKKELFPISLQFSGTDKDGTRWTRTVRTKNGCCATCNRAWRAKMNAKMERELGI